MILKCQIQQELAKKNWRQMAVFRGSGGSAAVSHSFLINIIKATTILPNHTAVTHFLAGFFVGLEVAIAPLLLCSEYD